VISGSFAMFDVLPDTIIHTDRVALRPIVRNDVSTLARLLFDPAVLVWMPALHMIVSIHDAEALFEAAISIAGPERFDFVASRRRDGVPIGEVTVPASGGELEFWLASEFWGQGYATEIVSCVLRLLYANEAIEPVFACVHRDNIGSQRVLQKAGMEVAEAYWHRFEDAENPVPLLTYRVDVMRHPRAVLGCD
jgi:ribosomal-protein-alanine N-acetyltransferase